ncbi:hypothetical protein DAEQUDRAFT_404979 [Daedalea quercina L-15889]|uniref:Uncharacterized protein n=1 Tax=Daedalea quercina L-15889 TaxID=1314783 RepID=A0A165NM59_9APHY|nr:hypothetical protein DAEQUDRAFT_404979 [Daedalea quercina L-15889]
MIGVELFREGHVPLDILVPARTTNEYTYNFTNDMFPISSAREELYEPDLSLRHKPSPQFLSSSATAPLVTQQTRVLYEIPGFPGVLEDGRWTARHPFVQTYLVNLGNIYASATGFTGGSTSRGEAARDVYGCTEVGRVEDVGEVIGTHLSCATAEIVFTLSALEVVDRIRHPAHFALWGETVRERTAVVVKRIQAILSFHQSPGIAGLRRRGE